MPVLNDADQVYLGTTAVDSVYLGTAKVWPPGLDTIPGLSSWVEADDVPQTVSGPITVAIPARVGPTPLSTPNARLLMNSTGGYKAFDFNLDPDQWLDVHNVTLGPDLTMLAVVDAGAQPYEHADLMDFNHAVGGGWVIQQNGYGPGTFFAWRKGGAFTLTGDLSYPGVPHIVEIHKEGGHARMSFGAATTSVDGAAGLDMTTGQLRVGNYANPAGPVRPLLGKISAWAIWARALTPAELSSARSYFQEKWLPPHLDPDTQAYLTATGLDPSYAPTLDALVVGLKQYGLWTKMSAIYPMIGGTAALHRWNLRDPRDLDAAYRLTYSVPDYGTHSDKGGYRPNLNPDTTVGYADTHLVPAGSLDPASIHMSLYSLSTLGVAPRCDMGAYNWNGSGGRFHLIVHYTSGECYYSLGHTGVPNAPGGDGSGMFVSSRTAINAEAVYRNGVGIGSNGVTGGMLPPVSLLIGLLQAYPREASNTLFGFASIGSGLTAQNVADLYTVVQAFQTSLGRAI